MIEIGSKRLERYIKSSNDFFSKLVLAMIESISRTAQALPFISTVVVSQTVLPCEWTPPAVSQYSDGFTVQPGTRRRSLSQPQPLERNATGSGGNSFAGLSDSGSSFRDDKFEIFSQEQQDPASIRDPAGTEVVLPVRGRLAVSHSRQYPYSPSPLGGGMTLSDWNARQDRDRSSPQKRSEPCDGRQSPPLKRFKPSSHLLPPGWSDLQLGIVERHQRPRSAEPTGRNEQPLGSDSQSLGDERLLLSLIVRISEIDDQSLVYNYRKEQLALGKVIYDTASQENWALTRAYWTINDIKSGYSKAQPREVEKLRTYINSTNPHDQLVVRYIEKLSSQEQKSSSEIALKEVVSQEQQVGTWEFREAQEILGAALQAVESTVKACATKSKESGRIFSSLTMLCLAIASS
jgi:hypothetical protein